MIYNLLLSILCPLLACQQQGSNQCYIDNTTCDSTGTSYSYPPRNLNRNVPVPIKKYKHKSLRRQFEDNYWTTKTRAVSYKQLADLSWTCWTDDDHDVKEEESDDHVPHDDDDKLDNLLSEREWKKNFASVECGAKLIKSSPNIKHANHLINKNLDEYMMNECKEETFFIIELCETIKLLRVELDNFELYSGTPKNFTVRTVDKYSNNINDWVVIGNFEASSQKMEVQDFPNLKLKSFGKLIRVDISSHYGTEHFCTLTSFRVFGISEYEFLSLTDDDNGNETETEEEIIEEKSSVETRLNELVIQKPKVEKEQTTTLTYKNLFLQMRNDVCVDSVIFETFNSQSLAANKDNIESIEIYTKVEKVNASAVKETEKNVNITENTINISNTVVPKESILVQISNKVKVLEKNLTSQGNILRNFNSTSRQQRNDIDKILETILKAKVVFEETAGETDTIKGKVKTLNKKIDQFEEALGDSAETLKLMMAVTIILSITCIFLVSIICIQQNHSPTESSEDEVFQEEEYIEEEASSNTLVSCLAGSEEVRQKDAKKRVTFSDEDQCSEDDISRRIVRRKERRKREPHRRATWCGGSFRKLTEDAARLVAKDI